MLKLNQQLGLPQPGIVDTPFSSLNKMLDNIVDIDDHEHFQGVKERLAVAKRQVGEAIQQFELGQPVEAATSRAHSNIDLLKKAIIAVMVKDDYQQDEAVIIDLRTQAARLDNAEINGLLAGVYYNWGVALLALAKTSPADEAAALYQQACEKYATAIL